MSNNEIEKWIINQKDIDPRVFNSSMRKSGYEIDQVTDLIKRFIVDNKLESSYDKL